MKKNNFFSAQFLTIKFLSKMQKSRRGLTVSAITVAAALGLVGCNADDKFVSEGAVANTRSVTQNPCCTIVDSVTVSGVISANTTWSCDTLYKLNGKVYVSNGATLTIEAGTIIKGLPSATTVNASALVITRGSKIIAQGDCSNPIVFTAANGEKGGWGGLVLLGKAVNNQGTDILIEGIDPSTAPEGVDVYYGGTDDCDNSGILSYVVVEFAGASIAANNELNSFTFGSVGCGTQVDHLQAYYGADDAFEFFGGTVNAKCLISTATDDDAFDFDFGYRGHLQFLLAVIDPNASYSGNPNGIECDNEGSELPNPSQPFTRPVISNLTVVGTSDGTFAGGNLWHGAHFRRSAHLVLRNSILYGYNDPAGNQSVIYLQGAPVTNWLGTNPYVCDPDSSYLADNVIGLINGAVAYDPANAVTVNSNTVTAATGIVLSAPFAYADFFNAGIAPLRPTGNPALTGAEFDGLNCGSICDACDFEFIEVDYKGAIPPTDGEVSCCGGNGYWIAADWVNTEFPIY
jgi:hypothetical protein